MKGKKFKSDESINILLLILSDSALHKIVSIPYPKSNELFSSHFAQQTPSRTLNYGCEIHFTHLSIKIPISKIFARISDYCGSCIPINQIIFPRVETQNWY